MAAHLLQICSVTTFPSMLSSSAVTLWVSCANMKEHPSWTVRSAAQLNLTFRFLREKNTPRISTKHQNPAACYEPQHISYMTHKLVTQFLTDVNDFNKYLIIKLNKSKVLTSAHFTARPSVLLTQTSRLLFVKCLLMNFRGRYLKVIMSCVSVKQCHQGAICQEEGDLHRRESQRTLLHYAWQTPYFPALLLPSSAQRRRGRRRWDYVSGIVHSPSILICRHRSCWPGLAGLLNAGRWAGRCWLSPCLVNMLCSAWML